MKVLAIYHQNSDSARPIEEFARSLETRTGKKLELISLETPEGDEKAQVYGIVDYPSIIVITDEGALQKLWQGSQLPLVDEVVSYLIA